MAPPPISTPHSMERSQIAARTVVSPTSIQWRTWIRSTLGAIVELLEAPQRLDEAHERAHGGQHGGHDRGPGGPAETVVEVPPDEGAGGDRAGELERHGHPAAVAHRGGRPAHVSPATGPAAPRRPAGRCPPRCAPARGTWPRTATAAGTGPRPACPGRSGRRPRCRPPLPWRSRGPDRRRRRASASTPP